MRLRNILLLLLSVALPASQHGQSTLATNNALFRTFMIETNFGRGTAFTIDVDGREYWITAKHMFTGVQSGPAGVFTTKTVQANILSQTGEGVAGHDLHWVTTNFKTMDPGKDVDIVVLAPDHSLLSNLHLDLNVTESGVNLGGDCEFLGYPYGGGWKADFAADKNSKSTQAVWLPYIRRCTVSGEVKEGSLEIWILDGTNNHGFSGGPVLYGSGQDQKVFAVISGYHEEPLEVVASPANATQTSLVPTPPVLPGDKPAQNNKQVVNVNSGFILAFSIQPAIEAIRANPIGPMISASSVSPAQASDH